MFSGVCGGLGEYFDIDPTIIRLLAVFAILSSCFTGLIAYFVCAMVIPQRPIGTPYATSGHSEQPSQESNETNDEELK